MINANASGRSLVGGEPTGPRLGKRRFYTVLAVEVGFDLAE